MKKAAPKKKAPSKKPAEKIRKVTAEIVHDDEPGTEHAKSNSEGDDQYHDGNDDSDFSDSRLPVATPSAKTATGLPATTDPVSLYLSEIRKYPLLSREEELSLAKKYYETKDPTIAQRLVTSNLRFVVKIAAEYSKFGARMIDLVQEGNMGLMHAVKDFNPYKGVRLITYAVWWIRGYIQEYLMKQYSMVRIGTTQNQKKLFYQLQKEKEALDALAENPEQLKLLSSRLGIPEDEVKMMAQRMSGRDVSLNQTVGDEGTTTLLDYQKGHQAAPDQELSRQEELSHLTEAIEALRPSLSEREKIILEERILNDEPLTLQEIGEKYGITREAVRQMEARVMKKIKDYYQKS